MRKRTKPRGFHPRDESTSDFSGTRRWIVFGGRVDFPRGLKNVGLLYCYQLLSGDVGESRQPIRLLLLDIDFGILKWPSSAV
jgi:hypothetical protein